MIRASSSAEVRGATRATAVGSDDEEQAPRNVATSTTAAPTRIDARIRVV
jgi:hypothetical protein